jgi:hypothetical protein
MKKEYCFRIHFESQNFSKISKLMELEPNDTYGWAYKFNETNFMSILDKIEKKITHLNKIESLNDKIELWIYYEYEHQCNLEFDPLLLKRLGKMGCTLCISCWDKI